MFCIMYYNISEVVKNIYVVQNMYVVRDRKIEVD